MITLESRLRGVLVLALAVWATRLAWGQDAGAGADRDRARLCYEKNAALRREFDQTVAANISCKKSSDCKVIAPGCPFGCHVAVARGAVSEVERRARELAKESECRCMHRCTAAPRAQCVHNKCTIESER
jgi:hypothetical protein